jgi:hypothetical protein
VRLGLRLADSYLGVWVIALFHALWVLIGLILCFVLIAFAVLGKADAFRNALNPVALYGYVLPLALMAATTWAVKLFSRLLWCCIPEPVTATFLALASVVGRLSVLFALGYVRLSGGAFGKGLLLPATIACSGVAWLCLVAEWRFIRILQRDSIPAADPAPSPEVLEKAVENETRAEGVTGRHKKNILTRDVGEWFKSRFPRGHKFVGWVLLPLAYVTASALGDKGDLEAVPEAILRLAVIAPAFLQAFWVPGGEIARLINALSQKTTPENSHPTSPAKCR